MSLFDAVATRLGARRKSWRPGPLLPPARGRDQVLVFVVAVLTFLACLAGISALGANRAAQGWEAELAGSASVLVRPLGGESPDAAAALATETLAGVEGVEEAVMLDRAEAEDLLRPWIGGEVLADLPIPRLIAIELDPDAPASAEDLEAALAGAGIDGEVDDHSMWIGQIVRAGEVARLAAAAITLLLAAAAGAVVAYATRASIAAYHESVEVLHFAGAEDRLIADLLARRFGWLAIRAALIGAVLAATAAAIVRAAGGSGGLTPVLPVAWSDLLAVLTAPFAAAAVAVFTARVAALRLLGRSL
jgi:cell division transport system permease protein